MIRADFKLLIPLTCLKVQNFQHFLRKFLGGIGTIYLWLWFWNVILFDTALWSPLLVQNQSIFPIDSSNLLDYFCCYCCCCRSSNSKLISWIGHGKYSSWTVGLCICCMVDSSCSFQMHAQQVNRIIPRYFVKSRKTQGIRIFIIQKSVGDYNT